MSGTRARPSSEDVGEVIDHLVRQRQPARLTNVAAELGVSPRTVQRAMAADRDTFSKRHNESRLYVAAHELVVKGASVRRAGEVAGFATTNDFCAVFKASFGVSPGALRTALREELSSHEIASRYRRAEDPKAEGGDTKVIPGLDGKPHLEGLDAITASMTREALELFEELMDEKTRTLQRHRGSRPRPGESVLDLLARWGPACCRLALLAGLRVARLRSS